MILLSDAMVLMDLGYVEGIDALAKIAYVEVLDVVLQECDHDLQPNLVRDIRNAGIKEVTTSTELALIADEYRSVHYKLSLQDSLCLHYAKQNKRVLLTNEKQMRTRCIVESVEAHGTIWVMEQVHAKSLRTQKQLCGWLSILSTKERRLPKVEIERLMSTFGCSN